MRKKEAVSQGSVSEVPGRPGEMAKGKLEWHAGGRKSPCDFFLCMVRRQDGLFVREGGRN